MTLLTSRSSSTRAEQVLGGPVRTRVGDGAQGCAPNNKRPRLDLFGKHASWVIRRNNLGSLRLEGSVRRLHRKTGIWVASIESRGRRISVPTRRVILALGAGDVLRYPKGFEDAPHVYAGDLAAPTMHRDNGSNRRITIVGAGLAGGIRAPSPRTYPTSCPSMLGPAQFVSCSVVCPPKPLSAALPIPARRLRGPRNAIPWRSVVSESERRVALNRSYLLPGSLLGVRGVDWWTVSSTKSLFRYTRTGIRFCITR